MSQLELARLGAPPAAASAYDATLARYQALAKDQAVKKDELKARAEQDQKTYDALNYRDDQFNRPDALIAIAIAMLAVTALTRLWALFWASLVPTVLGFVMGLAGLATLPIHPDFLVRLLS